MRNVKFFSPTELNMSARSVNGVTVTGNQVSVGQYSRFLVAFTYVYTGAPTVIHNLIVLLDDTPASTLVHPLIAEGLSAAQNWTSGTIWFKWGKDMPGVFVAAQSFAGAKQPLLCSGTFPVSSFALQAIGSAAAATVTARMWARR